MTAARLVRPRRAAAAVVRPIGAWSRPLSIFVLVVWMASFAIGFERALAIQTLAAFAITLWGIQRPAVAAIGVGMLCTLDPITRMYLMSGGLLRWNSFNYFLLGFFVLWGFHLRRVRGAPFLIAVALLVLLAAEIPGVADIDAGVQVVLNLASVLCLMAIFVRAANEPDVWSAIGVVCSVLAAVGGVVFYVQGVPSINPNAWAWFPLTGILAICLAAGAGGRQGGQVSMSMLAFVNFVWVFLSASRGDMIVGVAGLAFVVFSGGGVSRKALSALAGVLLVVVTAREFTSLSEHALHRLGTLTNTDESVRMRTSGRSELALGGWYIFLDHPFGVGTGGFPAAWSTLGQRPGMTGFQRGEEFQAHSAWVKTLAENGLPGFLLLAAFVVSLAVSRPRAPSALPWRLGLLASGVLGLSFFTTEFQSKGIWFLAAGTMTLLHCRLCGTVPTRVASRRVLAGRPAGPRRVSVA